ncbi:MAG: hypothetical protein FJX62_11160 [Alphaproteobacteria bacterium]|nr:hypothetical protein [Alphaproteobacteria bacterium]
MQTFATVIVVLAVAGALASWVVAAVYTLRTLASISGPDRNRQRLFAIVAWPFAVKRLQGAPAEQASRVNKSLVAFFACLTVAIAAISIMTNLARYSR